MFDWTLIGVKPRVISLRSRKDRHDHVNKVAAELGMEIEFFLADKHPEGGTHGCFDSHIQVCQQAIMRGQTRVFILEDDFEPTSEFSSPQGESALREAISFINTTDDWDLMYLGVMPNIWSERSERKGQALYRMKPWACTHAMIINENYMKEMSTWKFAGKDAIDWRHRTCRRAYSFHPQAMKQCESPSDIRRMQIPSPDFLRDLPVNTASWYAHRVGYSLAHISMLCGITVLTFAMGRVSAMQTKNFAIRTLGNGISSVLNKK